MNFLIWNYLIGLLLIAAWIIFIMAIKLDEFDWQYHKNDIWFNCTMTLLFWPFLLILKPMSIFNANQLFDFDIVLGSLRIQGFGQRMRRLHQLAHNPPPCSNTIYYRYQSVDEVANIWFRTDDFLEHYSDKNLPLFSSGEKVALNSWIKNTDETLNQHTEVPDQINFEDVAASLLDAGFGLVECKQCKTCYPACELNSKKEPIHRGWNFITYFCPKGHALLKHNYVHFSM